MSYKNFLEGLAEGVVDKDGKKQPPVIKDCVDSSTEVAVDFVVTLPKGKLQQLEAADGDANGVGALEKLLKLTTTVSTKNMHMFDADCKLHKYANVEEIIAHFYKVRHAMYEKRKSAQIGLLQKRLSKLSNRAKYVQYLLVDKIDLRRKKAAEIDQILANFGFDMMDNSASGGGVSDYKYLTKMPMDSVSEENVEKIMKEKSDTETELAELMAMTVERIWLKELDVFENEYAQYKKKRERIQKGETSSKTTTKSNTTTKSKTNVKRIIQKK
jgi:DNA topoisomerase-2